MAKVELIPGRKIKHSPVLESESKASRRRTERESYPITRKIKHYE